MQWRPTSWRLGEGLAGRVPSRRLIAHAQHVQISGLVRMLECTSVRRESREDNTWHVRMKRLAPAQCLWFGPVDVQIHN